MKIFAVATKGRNNLPSKATNKEWVKTYKVCLWISWICCKWIKVSLFRCKCKIQRQVHGSGTIAEKSWLEIQILTLCVQTLRFVWAFWSVFRWLNKWLHQLLLKRLDSIQHHGILGHRWELVLLDVHTAFHLLLSNCTMVVIVKLMRNYKLLYVSWFNSEILVIVFILGWNRIRCRRMCNEMF